MIDCAECGSPDGRYIVPGGHDVLCWRCYTRRLGADQDIPRPTTPEQVQGVTGRLRQDYEERHGTSDADQPMTLPAPTAPMHVARVLVKSCSPARTVN